MVELIIRTYVRTYVCNSEHTLTLACRSSSSSFDALLVAVVDPVMTGTSLAVALC